MDFETLRCRFGIDLCHYEDRTSILSQSVPPLNSSDGTDVGPSALPDGGGADKPGESQPEEVGGFVTWGRNTH